MTCRTFASRLGLIALGFVWTSGCSTSTANQKTDAAGGLGGIGGTSACVHVTSDDVFRRDSNVLPQGACTTGTPACDLVVRDPCPCLNIQLPRKFYECTCVDLKWQCVMTSQDSGYCAASEPACITCDASTCDAG